VHALDDDTVAVLRHPDGIDSIAIVARLAGAGDVDVPLTDTLRNRSWTTILTTEDPAFTPDPKPLRVHPANGSLRVTFAGPAAIVLRGA
jgi:hypothetical protein